MCRFYFQATVHFTIVDVVAAVNNTILIMHDSGHTCCVVLRVEQDLTLKHPNSKLCLAQHSVREKDTPQIGTNPYRQRFDIEIEMSDHYMLE